MKRKSLLVLAALPLLGCMVLVGIVAAFPVWANMMAHLWQTPAPERVTP